MSEMRRVFFSVATHTNTCFRTLRREPTFLQTHSSLPQLSVEGGPAGASSSPIVFSGAIVVSFEEI